MKENMMARIDRCSSHMSFLESQFANKSRIKNLASEMINEPRRAKEVREWVKEVHQVLRELKREWAFD